MTAPLIKALLNTKFYVANKHRIDDRLFPANLRPLMTTIHEIHKQYPKQAIITRDELWSLHKGWNPTLTQAKKDELWGIVEEIGELDDMSPEIAEECLALAWMEETCRDVASIALEISEGQHNDWSKVEDVIAKAKSGYIDDDAPEYITTDPSELLGSLRTANPWVWNYPPLQATVGPIGGGNFIVLAARPDCGKTAAWVSFTFGRQGWLDQGAKVHVICNEEPAHRVMARGISCYTERPIEHMREYMSEVTTLFSNVQDNIFMQDKVELTLDALSQYIEDSDVDILIIDQLDKIKITGQYTRDDIRLKELYVGARELAKKHDIAVMGISQAGYEAHGKLYYGFESLDGSKTGKAAEADVVLCIGMPNLEATNGEDDGKRMINIPKNKLTGLKKPIPYFLNRRLAKIQETE